MDGTAILSRLCIPMRTTNPYRCRLHGINCAYKEDRSWMQTERLTVCSITDWNVVICVLSMFILLAKVVMYITEIFPPVISAIVHGVLTIFYIVSITQQAASDYSDPDHPSTIPWYLTKGCGPPVSSNLTSACQQAKASFSVTCVMRYCRFTLLRLNCV